MARRSRHWRTHPTAVSRLKANCTDLHLRDKYNQDVDNAERAADLGAHEITKAIHKTFITLIDRLKSDADRVMRTAMGGLLREEPGVREVIMRKAIYPRRLSDLGIVGCMPMANGPQRSIFHRLWAP
ncbi:MAG: hypothetical protein ACK40S_05025 [Burkholderiaceae bacterium]